MQQARAQSRRRPPARRNRGIRTVVLLAAAWAPLFYGVASRNRKTILLSAALTPALLGIWAAADRNPHRALRMLVPLVAVFVMAYGIVLYYIWLRLPWS